MNVEIAILEDKLLRLQSALSKELSESYCLKLWSDFIRTRDENFCVACNSGKFVAAHHIFRKSFLIEARFQMGNGITLCRECHKEAHALFNKRPNFQLPMDAENGEKIEMAL